MTSQKLEQFLQSNHVPFRTLEHPYAMTAQATAARANVDEHEMAKIVMVWLDDRLAMAVVPSNELLDLARLREASGARAVSIASEADFKHRFAECEVGAMPPFGNLYGMDVYADDGLAKDEHIAFNAGSHRELVSMEWRDYERLVRPRVVPMTRH
jgi:Ala-tRNA(Pro) deacylase